jgi:hypothetical protein
MRPWHGRETRDGAEGWNVPGNRRSQAIAWAYSFAHRAGARLRAVGRVATGRFAGGATRPSGQIASPASCTVPCLQAFFRRCHPERSEGSCSTVRRSFAALRMTSCATSPSPRFHPGSAPTSLPCRPLPSRDRPQTGQEIRKPVPFGALRARLVTGNMIWDDWGLWKEALSCPRGTRMFPARPFSLRRAR